MKAEFSFGAWLRQRRRALHLTQEELARQVSCSAITLRKLEAEARRPSKEIAERLAQALNVAPDDRTAFLRFARGDPFAAPASSPTASHTTEPPQAPRHNLPLQLTSFIGRETEIEAVRHRLSQARLVTLTGVGGSGKTRLALEVAGGLLYPFADGVWLAELASLSDPALVPQVVATALGVQEKAGQPIVATLLEHLRDRTVLLVLDNCEHLVQICAELTETLLRACSCLTVLATSRQALGVTGESVYLAPGLSLPSPNPIQSLECLAESEAIQLFVARGLATWPGFALTNDNAAAVAQICRQLDGIPLAIELAAARVTVLNVGQIAARLSDRFGLLKGGSRTALPRHRTLQGLMDWSYDLLSKPERVLLQRLAVFMGGWTLEAAEAVGAREGVESTDVLDLLTQLVNKSLVVFERESGPSAHYHLLETIRQYGLAKLDGSDEAEAVRRRHAEYYLALAEAGTAIASTLSPEPAWFDRIGTEYDNLRAALAWTQSAAGSAELALRLLAGLGLFWWRRGYFSEARRWCVGALALAGAADHPPAQAEILLRLALIEAQLGDYAAGQAHLERSVTLSREQRDLSGSAYAVRMLGWMARERGDAAAARPYLEESVRLFRDIGDPEGLADSLTTLGEVVVMQEDAAGATMLLEEGLALWRERHDRDGIGWALNHLGHAAQIAGEFARARRLHEESLSLFSNLDSQYYGLVWAHQGLGETALAQRDAARAATHFAEALTLSQAAGYRAGMSWCLTGLAGAAALDDEPERAAQLWGAAEALRQSIGARDAPASRATRERLMAAAREQLGEVAFAAAWTAGEAASLAEAIERALQSEVEA